MSSILSVYLVDGKRIVDACGSKDRLLLADLLAKHADDIRRFDEWNSIEDANEGLASTIRKLIDGEDFSVDRHGENVTAYEVLCQHYGERMSMEHFQDYHGSYLEEVDQALAAIGVGDRLSTTTLLARGTIPGMKLNWDEYAPCGYVLPDEARAIIGLLPEGDTGVIHDVDVVAPDIAGAVEEFCEVLIKAAREGRTVVTIES